jgi:hypothetical protein
LPVLFIYNDSCAILNTIEQEISMTQQTRDQILADIRSRQQPREVSSRPREVYKERKIEIQNYTSLHKDEDVTGVKVSTRPASWPEAVASDLVAIAPQEIPLAGTSSQEESGIVISAPRELTSRYSGISVQHVKTPKGVKLAITLQKPHWVSEGACQMATAELKVYDRMREVKARDQDSEHFAEYLKCSKQQLQDAANKSVCIGRLHQRTKRSAWLFDTLAIAKFEDHKIQTVMLYLEGEEYLISMDQDLTDSQQKYYLAQGRSGTIASSVRAPRLDDLPLQKFGG